MNYFLMLMVAYAFFGPVVTALLVVLIVVKFARDGMELRMREAAGRKDEADPYERRAHRALLRGQTCYDPPVTLNDGRNRADVHSNEQGSSSRSSQ